MNAHSDPTFTFSGYLVKFSFPQQGGSSNNFVGVGETIIVRNG